MAARGARAGLPVEGLKSGDHRHTHLIGATVCHVVRREPTRFYRGATKAIGVPTGCRCESVSRAREDGGVADEPEEPCRF